MTSTSTGFPLLSRPTSMSSNLTSRILMSSVVTRLVDNPCPDYDGVCAGGQDSLRLPNEIRNDATGHDFPWPYRSSYVASTRKAENSWNPAKETPDSRRFARCPVTSNVFDCLTEARVLRHGESFFRSAQLSARGRSPRPAGLGPLPSGKRRLLFLRPRLRECLNGPAKRVYTCAIHGRVARAPTSKKCCSCAVPVKVLPNPSRHVVS